MISERGIARFFDALSEQMVDSAEDVLSQRHFPPASAPGEVPHRRTGRLATSWEIAPQGNGVAIISQVDYAAFLENGTTRMAARPFADEVARDFVENADVSRAAPLLLENVDANARR